MDSERPAKACKLDKGTRSSASVDGKTSPVYHHKATSSITGSSANSSSAVLPSSGHIDDGVSKLAHNSMVDSAVEEQSPQSVQQTGGNTPSGVASAEASPTQTSETPTATHPLGRQSEELYLPQLSANMKQGNRVELPRQHSYHTTQDFGTPGIKQEYGGGLGPGINVQQATPQGMNYTNSSSGSSLPGALQPGRPTASSINTSPAAVPTLPQISTQSQQYGTPTRSSASGHSHSYSRSSPAGLDQQKYVPFINTAEHNKYASPPSQRYTSSQMPQGAGGYSPLGLADIRPMSDDPVSANPAASDGYPSVPTNSNYLAPWGVYSFDWCKWPVPQKSSGEGAGKMAVGSYVEDGHNFIQILDTHVTDETDPDPEAPQHGIEFTKTAEATHSYPVTRILWEPASSQKQSTDLLATSGDHLRLWSLPSQPLYHQGNSITRSSDNPQPPPQKLTPLALLSNSKSPEHTAPLTSLDWNNLSPSLIITSSIDTTCTIWDIPTLTAKTQLIAHDKEVFDVRFCANSVDVFVSCGADGSVRMFDLRSLEHSTIIYEPSEKNDKSSSPRSMSPTTAQQTMSYAPPLLRLAASPHDAHLLATFSQDSNSIRILDVRQPGQALLELRGHAAAINCIDWSPSRRGTLASGGDDSLVLIWDLLNQSASNTSNIMSGTVPGMNGNQAAHATAGVDISSQGPAASWQCDYEVSNISWAPQSVLTSTGNDWLGVCGGRGVWGVCM